MSKLWGPGSAIRTRPQTPKAKTAAPQNLCNLGFGRQSFQWQRSIWPIRDCLSWLLPLQWLAPVWWGSRRQNQWQPPSLPGQFLSLDRLPILESGHASQQQMSARSSKQGRCYRTWCWSSRGLQAQNQPQLQLRSLHQLQPPPLNRSDSSLDRGAREMWPRWEGPCPQKDPCL